MVWGLEPSPGGLKWSATSFSPLEEEKTCLGRLEPPTQFPRNQGAIPGPAGGLGGWEIYKPTQHKQ